MKRNSVLIAFACAATLAGAGLAAQDRALVFSLYGGGADHLADLRNSPQVWFMPGYNAGASVGLQVNRYFAVHGDFTFTRNPTRGF